MAETLGTVASIIAVLGLAKSAVAFLRDIKDASAQCKSLITEISFTRGLLDGLKDTISDFDTARSWTETIELLAQDDGPITCLEKVLRMLNEKLGKQASGSKSKKIIRTVLWPFSKRETEEILGSIERQKLSLLLALENNHLRLAMAIREGTKRNGDELRNLQEDVKEVIEGISNIGITLDDHLSLNILSWISPINARAAQDQIYNNLAPGTGEWLFATPNFKAWVAGDIKTVFCPGIPGAGKSSLASQIIQYLETRTDFVMESHSVTWIYCDYRESTVQSVLLFIASLLKQNLQNSRTIPSSVKDLYDSHGKGTTSITLVEARDLLQSVVADLERCFVIVDALDECTDADGIREQVVKELRSLKPPISLLVTSRPILSIEVMFGDATLIPMEPHKEDLEIYIDRRLETEAKLHKIVQADDSLQQEIKSTLIAKNQGIFLMTKLHLDALAKKAKHSKRALRDALADLPLDLDKTYKDAMARIAAQDEEDACLAIQVLSWVLLSFRRMTVRELQEALAIQSDYDEGDEESLIDPEFFISVCGGLLVLDRGRYVEWISFVHLTTEEFFERNAATYFPNAGFDISSVCLKQLTLKPISLKEITRRPETAMNEFTEYAVRYAMLHVKASWESALFVALECLWKSENLQSIRKAFDYLTENGTALTILEEKALIHPYSDFTRLQLAVMYDFDTEAEAMIKKGLTENDPSFAAASMVSGEQTPAICIAVHNHNLYILDLLLKVGAKLDVVMVDEEGFTLTSLECALAREDLEMVKFLLDRSPALILYRPVLGRTALHFAVDCKLHEFVSYLIGADVGLDVDERDENGQTALHYLAKVQPRSPSCNLIPTFNVLQEASATVNAHDALWKTPLDYIKAVNYAKAKDYSDHTQELQDVLVIHGAVVGRGRKLHEAISGGSLEEAQELLDSQAKIDLLGEGFMRDLLKTLLNRRSYNDLDFYRASSLVRRLASTLVDLGARIQSEYSAESDLHWLIEHLSQRIRITEGTQEQDPSTISLWRDSHLHVFRLLIHKFDDVDVLFLCLTPLYLASSYGEVEMVELLLSKGANDNFVGFLGRPIEMAAIYCYPRVVEALLARKPRVHHSLVSVVESAVRQPFQNPLTFPRDRHETIWLLCAYNGWDFPRCNDAIRSKLPNFNIIRDDREGRYRQPQTEINESLTQGTASDPYRMTFVHSPLGRGIDVYHSITSMEIYQDYSFEELRLADYNAGRL